MAEVRRYYVDKEVLKERCCELIDFAYTQELTALDLSISASIDAVAVYELKVNGFITRKGELNE